MPFGTQVGLSPSDIVLDGDPAPLPKKGAEPAPIFGPCLLWPNGRPSLLLLSSCPDGSALSSIITVPCRVVYNSCTLRYVLT